MKILALTILFILLFFRIKGTPSALSKTLWRNKMLKTLDENKEAFNGNLPSDAFQGGVVIFTLFIVASIIDTIFLSTR